jgi:hypothetical protein
MENLIIPIYEFKEEFKIHKGNVVVDILTREKEGVDIEEMLFENEFPGFEKALKGVKRRLIAKRKIWNEEYICLFLPYEEFYIEGILRKKSSPFLVKRKEETIVPYIPTQEDLLAEDWEVK